MNTHHNPPFYCGTSGLVIPIPKRSFPPVFQGKSRLTYYGSLFNSIEINSSFYKIPQASTLSKWAESVPDNFRFTFKLWREITHNKGLAFEEADVERFIGVINSVAQKAGCLLVQFPPSMGVENVMQLQKLLTCIGQYNINHAWKVAVEFRNRSWYQPDVYDVLSSCNAAMVCHDLSASASPWIDENAFIYLRFHGPNGGYRGSYADDFLSEYAHYIAAWRAEGKEVFVYFNNTMGEAVKNALYLSKLEGE